jgi:hypothetical protein
VIWYFIELYVPFPALYIPFPGWEFVNQIFDQFSGLFAILFNIFLLVILILIFLSFLLVYIGLKRPSTLPRIVLDFFQKINLIRYRELSATFHTRANFLKIEIERRLFVS